MFSYRLSPLFPTEDATYVQGLYETCRGLLDKMDSLRAERRGLKAALAAHGQKRGKNLLADYRRVQGTERTWFGRKALGYAMVERVLAEMTGVGLGPAGRCQVHKASGSQCTVALACTAAGTQAW